MDDISQPATTPTGEKRTSRESQLPLWPAEGAAPVAQPSESSTVFESNPSPMSSDMGAPRAAQMPLAQNDPPWKLADLGMFIVFAMVTFLFANAVATGVFLLVRGSFGWNLRVEQVLTQTPFLVFMQVLWESLWFLFIYQTVVIKYRRPFWQAIRWLPTPQGPKAYLLGGIVLAVVAQGLFSLFPSEKHLPIERLFSSTTSGYLLAMFGICVAPFMEELVFRGFFYPVFERRWGLASAVLITALLFALIHAPQLSGGWPEMTAIFGVGVALSYTRGKTGSLVPSYLMHLAYNSSLFVSLYLATDQFRKLQG